MQTKRRSICSNSWGVEDLQKALQMEAQRRAAENKFNSATSGTFFGEDRLSSAKSLVNFFAPELSENANAAP